MLIIGNFIPIINTYLPIYIKKLFIVQKQKVPFKKLELWAFQKVQKLSYKLKSFHF